MCFIFLLYSEFCEIPAAREVEHYNIKVLDTDVLRIDK